LRWPVVNLFAEVAQRGYEGVFEGRVVEADVVNGQARLAQGAFDFDAGGGGVRGEKIEAVAETLNVYDLFSGAGDGVKKALGERQIAGAKFHAFRMKAGAQLSGSAQLANLALMHEGDAMAPLGLIEIGSSQEDGETFRGEACEGVPELAA